MHNYQFINDIVIILLIQIPVIFIFKKIKLPLIIGYLISGLIIGPNGLKLISNSDQISVMAEIGVILLLFSIGIELSIKKLREMKRLLLLGGGLQVLLTVIISALIFYFFDYPFKQSIFFGMLISLSSTAIVLKILTDKKEISAPHGRMTLGILIFQDLAIVPMILFLPILGSTESFQLLKIAQQLIISLVSVIIILLTAKYLMPYFLYQLANLRIREAFTIGILFLLLGTAYLTYLLGLSLALGAFIAGLILSESDYSHQIFAETLPFKDAFNSIFFMSVGMLFNFDVFLNNTFQIITIVAAIIVFKSLVIIFIIKLLKYPLRIGILTGLALAQIGEFSFVLSQEGMNYNLISEEYFNIFLSASIFTMIASPFLIQLASFISSKLASGNKSSVTDKKEGINLSGHVIIVGYGLNGKNIARVLKETGIKYVIIELNPEIVKTEKARGEKILYGDVTRDEVFYQASIETAKIVVFVISDSLAIQFGLKNAKNINPSIYAIVRTRYVSEIDNLKQYGADLVIPEEFETSLQIFSRVLERYHIPLNVIMKQVAILRGGSYSMLIKEKGESISLTHINEILAAGLTETFYVDENNKFIEKSLIEINLRALTGTTVIAIVRNEQIFSNPSGNEKLMPGDTLVITGNHMAVDKAMDYLGKTDT